MKKYLSLLICLAFLLSISAFAVADNRETTVYIASGSSSAYRYHRSADCSSLSHSIVSSLTLEEAAASGYTACSRCRPPEPDFEVLATPRPISPGSGSSGSRSLTDEADSRLSLTSLQNGITSFLKIGITVFAVCYVGFFFYGTVVIAIAKREEKNKKKK